MAFEDPFVLASTRLVGLSVAPTVERLKSSFVVLDPANVSASIMAIYSFPKSIAGIPCIYCSKALSDSLCVSPCGHVLHTRCGALIGKRYKTCPSCRKPVTNRSLDGFFSAAKPSAP